MALFRKKKKEQNVPVQEEVLEPTPVQDKEEYIESMEEEEVHLEKVQEENQGEGSSTDMLEFPEESELEKTQEIQVLPAADQMQAFSNRLLAEGLNGQKMFVNSQQKFGEQILAGEHYYFDPEQDGNYATDLVRIPAEYSLDGQDKTVFCSFRGNFLYGPRNIGGMQYFFHEENGNMACSELVEYNGNTYYYDAFGQQYRGLISLNGNKKYFDLDTGAMATGIVTIPAGVLGSEKTAGFDEEGNMLFGLQQKDGKVRCFDTWDGSMMKGLTFLSSEYGGPKTVYFDEDGIMVTGSVKINGRYMYFSKSGKMVANSTVRIGKDIFYYDQKGYRYHGPRYLKGKWKYFDEDDGHMRTGLVTLQDEDSPTHEKVVCYDEQGNMMFGQQKIDNHWKCFDLYDGHMFTGLTYLSEEYGGPKTVYYDEHGDMCKGSVLVNGAWMFFDDNGELVRSSMVTIDGNTYYYNDTGLRTYGQKYINGCWKYFDINTGIMATGLVHLSEDAEARGEKTVLYDKNGDMLYGLQKVEGKTKYFDPWDGHMTTGLVHFQQENGTHHTSYFNEYGDMVTGPYIVNGKEMFFSTDGTMVENTLVEYEGDIYYYDQNGYKFHGQTRINGKWKLFDMVTGKMLKGLQNLSVLEEPAGEKTVYYDHNGDMVYGLTKIDGQIKCFDLGTGAMKRGFVHLSRDYGEEKIVYFNEEGNMVFGEQTIYNQPYLFDQHSGALLKSASSIQPWISQEDALDIEDMKNNALLVWNHLSMQGWSKQAAAGLLANLQMTSTLNPGFESDTSFGMLAWPKSAEVIDWFENKNLPMEDGNAQMLRLNYEAQNHLVWEKSSEYPITFEEFIDLDFRPGYTARTFAKNYLHRDGDSSLDEKAVIWYNFLTEYSES